MERRTALKQLVILTGGVMLLPSCVREVRQVSIALKNIVITADQEDLLAEFVETLIPTTDTPGAKALGVHQFVLRMVDDCYETENQQEFTSGLEQVERIAKKRFNNSFLAIKPEERKTLLTDLDQNSANEFLALAPDEKDNTKAFYTLVKRHGVQGYLSSQFIMTEVLVHTMIPGRFDGCIEIKDKNDIQTVIG